MTAGDESDRSTAGTDGDGPEAADAEYAKFWVNTEDDDYEPVDVTNVKEEWENLTIYLPDELRDEIELAFRETSYECMRAKNYDLQKLRDFYPLLIVLGLESLESIEGEDVTDILAYSAAEYEFE
ncbi:hypothetical protein [Natrinema salifodinae]|uniref:DUF8160 domain-containing protein n=1 Tax=Natrinema salifodinae TaxID=1202768 RepID=A0A1I0P8P9_9EURY|nr:hypothetical protein [Natrinema salifodinae]SEW10664.1 hypothetical protein SAMN05216285_2277 [Natrinema salifodinae]